MRHVLREQLPLFLAAGCEGIGILFTEVAPVDLTSYREFWRIHLT